MTTLAHLMALAVLAPLVIGPAVVVLALLLGRIPMGGIWRDSFAQASLSPARVFQFLAALTAAAAVLIGLARSGGGAFGPLPEWLLTAAGGGNAVYLGAKWQSSRRAQARRSQQEG